MTYQGQCHLLFLKGFSKESFVLSSCQVHTSICVKQMKEKEKATTTQKPRNNYNN